MDRVYCSYVFVKGTRKNHTCDRWVKKPGNVYCYQHKGGSWALTAIPEENEEVPVPVPVEDE